MSVLDDEALRVKLHAKSRAALLAKIATGVSAAAGVVFLAAGLWPVGVVFLLAAVACVVVNVYASRDMKRLVSDNVVAQALGEVFDVELYVPDRYIGAETLRQARLIHNWNRSSGSDTVYGRYRGVTFVFSDVHLEDEETSTDSDGNTNTTTTTRFRGQWLMLEAKKALPHMVRLRERAQRRLTGSYKKTKSDVETENAAFNEKFEILTDDPHTAFYVLTPHFMEAIIAADERANARTYLCFDGQRVHIAVDNGRDSFEVKRGADVKDIDRLRARIKGEIRYIMEIVDELLQNTYLFGKEN